MEVDPPPPPPASTAAATSLKRSNSAPMINVLATSTVETSPMLFKQTELMRTRRFSSSNMSLYSSPVNTPIKPSDRINQIKREESHIANRETEHEREVRNAINMSSSLEEFSLDEPMVPERRQRSHSESLYIVTPPSVVCGSPSPTRPGKQCFSPSMQIPIKTNSFTPSPSVSPTTKTFLRSMSPIAMRHSPIGKRKCKCLLACEDNIPTSTTNINVLVSNMQDFPPHAFVDEGPDKFEGYLSPPKRLNAGSSPPIRILTHHHPNRYNVLLSGMEGGSPDQTLLHGSGGVSDALHQKQPAFSFIPVRDSREMQATDSETLDMTESTDMSENTEHIFHAMETPGFTPVKQAPV